MPMARFISRIENAAGFGASTEILRISGSSGTGFLAPNTPKGVLWIPETLLGFCGPPQGATPPPLAVADSVAIAPNPGAQIRTSAAPVPRAAGVGGPSRGAGVPRGDLPKASLGRPSSTRNV